MNDSLRLVCEAVDTLDIDGIRDLVQRCLEEGHTPEEIIEHGIGKGLDLVGKKFEAGEYFLADLVMAGEVVKEVMPVLKERMNPVDAPRRQKVILATVEGDIHEIGKNIVGIILSANGYEVVDLGVDVSAGRILQAVKETGAGIVGLSVLLSTMVGGIRTVVEEAKAHGIRDRIKIVIGGACTSRALCEEMGADAYGENAMDALRIVNGFSENA
ncbi:MAG TPA: cobalamin-dependent protein [Deltaproteobacteria bacterium]|nr:cobalamin-dependent protein [Deltaproteobacteria bacterium]HOM28745.1 cobalamin-dependent protein [Deltaproteobacteria bacterium]HPP81639.1 cobalamin-dependent protein [Deltaproteobacteria bacterium]